MSREVPEGWRSVKLGDIINIERAAMAVESICKQKVVQLYSLPAYDEWNAPEMVSGETIQSNKYQVPTDCILFSKLNPRIPRIWRVRHDHSDCALGSTEFWPLTRRSSGVDLDFLAFFLRSPGFLSAPTISSASSTNSHQRVDRTAFEAFRFALPPLPEQRRIAEILSSVDEAIAATRTVIAQTKTVKQGVLERLLTRGIGHTRFKQTEIGEIPEGWGLKRAADVCPQISVGIVVTPAKYYAKAGTRCFRSANVRDGFINDSDWVYISDEGNKINQKSVLRTGDVLVVRTGYPGTSCVVTPDYDGSNCIDIIFARPDQSQINATFLSAFINSNSGKTQVLKAEGGLAQKHFNVGAMKLMHIPVPPIAEQRAIVAHIEDMSSSEIMLKETLERTLQLKSALMSDLLIGRRRVQNTLPLAAE